MINWLQTLSHNSSVFTALRDVREPALFRKSRSQSSWCWGWPSPLTGERVLQNATTSMMLFVFIEISENSHFDKGFTPLEWKLSALSILYHQFTNDCILWSLSLGSNLNSGLVFKVSHWPKGPEIFLRQQLCPCSIPETETDKNWAHSGYTVITEVTSLFNHYEIGKSPIKVEA